MSRLIAHAKGIAILFAVFCAAAQFGNHPTRVFAQEPDEGVQDPNDPRKKWMPLPQYWPADSDSVIAQLWLGSISRHVKLFQSYCQRAGAPLQTEQIQKLHRAGSDELKALFRDRGDDLWLLGATQLEAYGNAVPSRPSVAYMRYIGAYDMIFFDVRSHLSRAVERTFERIATPEQRTACADCIERGHYSVRLSDRMVERAKRFTRGEFTEREIEIDRIDQSKPSDPRLLRFPDWKPFCDNYMSARMQTFVYRYDCNDEQRAAAKGILADCIKRASDELRRREADLQRAWSDVVVALLFPSESKIGRAQAIRAFRAASESVLAPFMDELMKRLTATLTSAQRAKPIKSKPKPDWMILLEEIRQPAASSQAASRIAR